MGLECWSKRVTKSLLTLWVQPEIVREDSRLFESVVWRKIAKVVDEPAHLFLDCGVLSVGAHMILAVSPQAFQRIKFRAAFWQPQQLNFQFCRKTLRCFRRMARPFVKQQRHRPRAIVSMNGVQELLKLGAASTTLRQE